MRAFAVAVGIVLAVVFASLSALRTAALLASPVRPVGDILTGLVSGLLAITFLGAALRAARHGNALMHPATRKAFRCIAKGMRARDWGVSAGELLDSTGATTGRSQGWPRLSVSLRVRCGRQPAQRGPPSAHRDVGRTLRNSTGLLPTTYGSRERYTLRSWTMIPRWRVTG